MAVNLYARAEITEADLADTGAPNQSYEDAASGGGLQTEVIYLRPSAPFDPDATIKIEVPEEPEARDASESSLRWIWGIIIGSVLALVIFILVKEGGAVGVTFGSTTEARRSQPDAEAQQDELDAINRQPLEQFLDTIARMKDRRQALILLVSRALERAADANSVRLGRAQTARDVIRVLPRKWQYMDTLRGLVREAEIVHFGGRDLSEDRWQECLSAAQPIFRAARASVGAAA